MIDTRLRIGLEPIDLDLLKAKQIEKPDKKVEK